jgi:hypothetical protein
VGNSMRKADEIVTRVAFVKGANGWESVCGGALFQKLYGPDCDVSRFSRQIQWFGFDWTNQPYRVKTLGVLRSNWLADVGMLRTANSSHVRDDADRTSEFRTHMSLSALRPIVVTNRAFDRVDPEGWREVFNDSVEIPLWVRQEVLSQFDARNLEQCGSDDARPQGAIANEISREVLTLRQHYRSSSGLELWRISIPNLVSKSCAKSQESQSSWRAGFSVWVYRDKLGKVGVVLPPAPHRVSTIYRRLEWLAAHDFDVDGSTEIVLWYSGYVHDGYVMLSDGLTKLTTFTWGYH